MFGSFDIEPRAALAAPTDPFVRYTQSIVIVVVSILSLLGGAWMVASFFAFSNLRSFRHQLILGLAISDSVMALNFLLSSSMNVGGRWIGAPEQAGFCTFNGFMTQVFVIQTDYWVFIIAIYTYFVLTDQKRCSTWIQEHPLVPWIVPWFLSLVWASVGLGVTGYGDIGAWCWFTSDEVRLLVNFVPRWAIIVIMFLMYARLYFVLFRAHLRLVSLEASESGEPSGSDSRQLGSSGLDGATAVSARHTRKLKSLARLMLLYPLAYAVVWSLPTGIRIYQTTSGISAPWQIQTADKACIVLQGLVDAIIYGATESSLSSWRNIFFPRRFSSINGVMIPALGRGDFGNKGSKKRGSVLGGEQQLVSRPPTAGEAATAVSNRSEDSLGSSNVAATAAGSSDEMELGNMNRTSAAMGIWRTVEIEITNSDEKDGEVLQKPGKAHFSDESRTVS
ncbi:G protein-coupled glucose receptor regulating Gpa2-domain-containing protein [Lasiosphaeris hirsuta]|uniref:G protein-coupled glucose receptor regulating Gpa2-domain-containing protein n=1 Tax=Lasiosphaeris hirsuta TaxID=260670 RepID=A0AA40DIB7_9PEZI|nr:G protein-coupled glucose receptor regulating Gpa2-domain-containing protein [Lasiosphaeris hirsuta]